ncbi:unnamed protein product [Allacma fusca]|uniref:Uncharacterized protein n=1 Tax=Allacma fusca TaxID=39272 RepID=A0A8J2KCF9_9HEXA|nr:unnamed protein product [Allacma fusca]
MSLKTRSLFSKSTVVPFISVTNWSAQRDVSQKTQGVTLAPEDKFQYLIQGTVEGSKARELVLKNAITPKENSCVSALYDKLETKLRALDTLGVTRDKFAAMLYPLVESCLPEDVLRAWERNRGQDYDSLEDKKDRLSMLMQFLKREVDEELRISMSRDGFGVDGKKLKQKIKQKPVKEIPTATELFSGHQAQNKFVCIFCEKGHPTQDCFKAPKMSLEDKRKMVQEKKACFVCLRRGHISKNAKQVLDAKFARKNVAMCPDVPKGKIETNKKLTTDGYRLQSCITSRASRAVKIYG